MLTLPLFTIFTIATTYCLLVYGPFMNHHFRSYPAVIKCGLAGWTALYIHGAFVRWEKHLWGFHARFDDYRIVPLVTRCITIISYNYICSWLSHVYPHQIPIVDGYVPMFHFLWFGSPKEWVTGSTAWAMARDGRKGAVPSSRSGARTKSNRMLESWVGCTLVRTR